MASVCRDPTGAIIHFVPFGKRLPLRVLDLLEELDTHYILIEHPIHNVNTPAEWRAWQNGELAKPSLLT
jgi:hypothetical protein